MTNIPAQATALIGRENELAAAIDLVRARRLVTLTGPGGIGKTGLAIEAARQLLPDFADDVWMIDLAPLTSADAVAPAVAEALGLGLDKTVVSPDQIAAALGSRHLLLVVDHCEHVVLAVARLAETLLRTNPAIHILATSHQPLLVADEQVCPVPPLAVPPAGATNRHDTLQLGAVKLFFARLRAADPGIVPDARMVALGGAICRRLDGIPLAIELAASRAATQGVADVAAQLDDYFKQLLGSRRTPLPRHKTLRAILDWRYGMLSAAERITLLHIAIFDGPFSLDDARTVASGAGPDVRDTVHTLVANSLVARETNGATMRYRLLGPIRAYSLEKLLESGEQDRVARAYAGIASEVRPDICREVPPRRDRRQGARRTFEVTSVLDRMATSS